MLHTPTKPALRSTLKATLAAIPPQDRTNQSNQLTPHLLTSNLYQAAATILAYAALPTEISLDPFITLALAEGKRICIPTINWESKAMQPAQILNLDTDLEIGRYGVRTPLPSCPLVEPNEINLILIPGLAFDRDFNRLGRGAGFYDRLIDSLPTPRPPLVGVCFASQIVANVPTEPHDHPMDRVITETGFIEPA
ncbi:MAG: 5-formyltetrahydrofolate cyclo-ligase [Phycisphaerales bacterium]|nr:5-formyltetrahydrofolate cyclo-ligase [Phycisphaerales bacterium]